MKVWTREVAERETPTRKLSIETRTTGAELPALARVADELRAQTVGGEVTCLGYVSRYGSQMEPEPYGEKGISDALKSIRGLPRHLR